MNWFKLQVVVLCVVALILLNPVKGQDEEGGEDPGGEEPGEEETPAAPVPPPNAPVTTPAPAAAATAAPKPVPEGNSGGSENKPVAANPNPTSAPAPKPSDKDNTDAARPEYGSSIRVAVFKEDVTSGDGGNPSEDLKFSKEIFYDIENNGNAALFSYSFDIWLVLMETLNIGVQWVFPDGMKNDLNSLQKLVLDGNASVIFSPIPYYITNDTKEVIYTAQMESERIKLYIKTPTSETSFSSLGNVFRPILWFTIIFAMALMAATLIFIEHMGYKAKLGTYLLAPADTGQLIIIILGNFCYQGAIQIASGCAGRVVIFSSLMCGYLVYISYSTLVISQLTAVKPRLPFETLEEMALRKDYKLIVRNDLGLVQDIENSRKNKDNALATTWDQLLPRTLGTDDLYNTEYVGVGRLCSETEKVAILTFDQRVTFKVMNRTKCSATALRKIYFRSSKGFAFSPKFPYTEIFQRTFARMREVGIMSRWRTFWNTVNGLNRDAEKESASLKPITLTTLLPVFGIVVVGVALGVIILAIEISYKHIENLHKNKMRDRQFKMFHGNAPVPFVN